MGYMSKDQLGAIFVAHEQNWSKAG